MLHMTENVGYNNLSLVGRIKMVLQEATERQTNHDFNTDMAVRAQQTAELYQIIDGISKDESKLEILQTKQRLRDRIQEVENDIKTQVSQLLAEETIQKANKVIEKDKGKHVKPFPLKTIQATPHSHEINTKQIPSNRSYLSPSYKKSDSQHNLAKSQSLDHRSCPLLSNIYPVKQYVLPLHSCSCLQNAYFYPLAQPSRIRKQDLAFRAHTSFTNSSKDPKILTAEKIYLGRGEPTSQCEDFLRNMHPNQTENDLKGPFNSRTFQKSIKFNSQEKFRNEVKERRHSLPESSQVFRFTETKSAQSHGFKKKHKNKYAQTDKHITWKSPRKPNEKQGDQTSRKVLERQSFPCSVKSPYSQPVMKPHTPKISAPANVCSSDLDNIHHESEQALERNNRMNDYLVESIKYLEARSRSELIRNLNNVDKSMEPHEMEAASRPMSYTDILNRLFSDTRNEEDIAALCSLLSFLQETDTQNSYNPSADRIPDIDKDLLERLIVDVIYEDLQGFSSPPEENVVSNENIDLEVASTETIAQQNLDVELHSEHGESEISASKILRNVVTPELSPENSVPSSSSSSPSSSPHFMGKPLPTTPLLSEQESTSEEILSHSQPKADAKVVSPISTPDLTPPLSNSPKHYVATPPSSPHPPNLSESKSHDVEIKKSVRDASVQVSKLSNSGGESTLGTIATSISDTTDEFLSDGELLLKSYGQVPLPAQLVRQDKKNSVTIQDYPIDKVTFQISKSSLSEGEVPLLTTGRSINNTKHPFQIIDSIDETQFPEPTNSTFEQTWEDISEGQIVPQHIKRNLKFFHLTQTSNFNETQYQRQLSNTLSEGEIISTPQAEAALCKSSSIAKQDNLNHYITLQKQSQNNMSLSSGEIEEDEDEKSNKNLLADEEENIPVVTDAEFFDEEKEPVEVQN